MSVEQINMQAVKGLFPTMGVIIFIFLVCVGVWFGTMTLCASFEKVKKIFMKIECGRLQRPPHCK